MGVPPLQGIVPLFPGNPLAVVFYLILKDFEVQAREISPAGILPESQKGRMPGTDPKLMRLKEAGKQFFDVLNTGISGPVAAR